MFSDDPVVPVVPQLDPSADPVAAPAAAMNPDLFADLAMPADPNATSAGGAVADPAAQKNPLDVLEELLKESQAKVGSPGGGAGAPPEPEVPAGPTPEQIQLQAELDERLRQQAVIDQKAIEERRAELLGLKSSPQYQARVQQEEEKAADSQAKQTSGQGFDIKQLEHKKI